MHSRCQFPILLLVFYKDVDFIMEAEWREELAVKPFEVLPVSDVKVAQNHFRSMTQGTAVRKCQNCQSKWVIRIEVLCLVLSDVHIKYFIITPRGRLYSSPFHRWEKRASEKQTCPKVMYKLRFDSKYIHHQRLKLFLPKPQHGTSHTANYEKSKVLLSVFWSTTDCKS